MMHQGNVVAAAHSLFLGALNLVKQATASSSHRQNTAIETQTDLQEDHKAPAASSSTAAAPTEDGGGSSPASGRRTLTRSVLSHVAAPPSPLSGTNASIRGLYMHQKPLYLDLSLFEESFLFTSPDASRNNDDKNHAAANAVLLLGSIVAFNLALLFHHFGALGATSRSLHKARALYQSAIRLVNQWRPRSAGGTATVAASNTSPETRNNKNNEQEEAIAGMCVELSILAWNNLMLLHLAKGDYAEARNAATSLERACSHWTNTTAPRVFPAAPGIDRHRGHTATLLTRETLNPIIVGNAVAVDLFLSQQHSRLYVGQTVAAGPGSFFFSFFPDTAAACTPAA